MRRWFTFPHPVNEAAARVVALGVVAQCVLALATGWAWITIPLTYGFVARVAAGPTFSPLGRFAVSVAAPRIEHSRLRHWVRFVPGPPKRFAQTMGLAFSLSALVTWLTVGWVWARWILIPLLGAACLEGFFAYCLGCVIFGWMIRAGWIPDGVCAECGDLSLRYRRLETGT